MPNPAERPACNLVHKKCSPQNYKRGGVWVGQKWGGWVSSKTPPPSYKRSLTGTGTGHSAGDFIASALRLHCSTLPLGNTWSGCPVMRATARSHSPPLLPDPSSPSPVLSAPSPPPSPLPSPPPSLWSVEPERMMGLRGETACAQSRLSPSTGPYPAIAEWQKPGGGQRPKTSLSSLNPAFHFGPL